MLLIASSFSMADEGRRGPEECRELGFLSADASPRCSHCSLLLQHTNEPSLYDECHSCCRDDSAELTSQQNTAPETFKKARLELDFRGVYPASEMSRFLEEHSKDFGPGFTVVDVYRMAPRILLIDEHGQTAETIRVQSWRCDLIVDFLKKKLAA